MKQYAYRGTYMLVGYAAWDGLLVELRCALRRSAYTHLSVHLASNVPTDGRQHDIPDSAAGHSTTHIRWISNKACGDWQCTARECKC